ncbi:MAG: serine/threonine protein kinase [Fastidiosipilaceae bacterium]|jgi:serine/threonine protein kinase
MQSRVGEIIDSKYEILKQIGQGGMSIVYLAMDIRLNKQWALKEIRKKGQIKKDEIIINSLLVEANLMKRLDHPALPRIVDIIDDGQTIFVVMDYVEGESLDKIIEKYGPQPQELVIDWGMQLCDALGYLHSQNPPIIYRDMKPDNIMLKPEGNLKVIDFGIAREYKEGSLSDTTVLGTKGYAPPEQHGSRQTDERSDIYALGMTLHHLLTGIDPRPADYIYVPIRQWDPSLSGGLERIINKCTALDPADRYQNCNELMYALSHYEEEDEAYKQKNKAKMKYFIAAVAMVLVMTVTGVAGQILKAYEINSQYDQLISVSDATPYDKKVESYLAAIDLAGDDPRAYLELLRAYQEGGHFGDNESNEFTARFNRNKEYFDKDSIVYIDMLYEAGNTYLYLYSGGDHTFRTRILKAYPFFKQVAESESETNPYVDVAESYVLLGEFYSEFVVDATSVKEPTKASYLNLLTSLEVCLETVDRYQSDDAAYIKLIMYRELSNLLHDHRGGLATTQVDETQVINILNEIAQKTNELSVTQAVSLDLQRNIMAAHPEYVENIQRSYGNLQGR